MYRGGASHAGATRAIYRHTRGYFRTVPAVFMYVLLTSRRKSRAVRRRSAQCSGTLTQCSGVAPHLPYKEGDGEETRSVGQGWWWRE